MKGEADRFRPTAGFCRYDALRTAAGGVGQVVRFDLSQALVTCAGAHAAKRAAATVDR